MKSPIRTLCTTGLTLSFFALVTPAISAAQATAVKCKDGSASATTGRGACSGHGGVDKTATKVEKKTVKAEEKTAKRVVKSTPGTQVTSLCADGTKSNTVGRGACSGHGGIKAAAATSVATGKPVAAAPVAAPKPAPMAAPKPAATARTTVGSGGREDNVATGAIAQCKDGMYSHAKNRTGVCSRHGGVARWM